jgi:REP element-mobilizing transposase RayT
MILETDLIEPPACNYLTLSTVDCVDIFIRPVFKRIIVESLNYYIEKKGLTVYGWCLMTNHLHLLAEGEGLAQTIQDFKKFTSRIMLEDIDAENEIRKTWMLSRFEEASRQLKLPEKYHVWENYNHPVFINLENKAQVREKLDHIHNNPMRDRVVFSPEDYTHSSAVDYAGGHGLVRVKLFQSMQGNTFILRHINNNKYQTL